MSKKEIVLQLNSILEFVNCNKCPLEDVCRMYEDAGNDSICNMLSDEIGVEED